MGESKKKKRPGAKGFTKRQGVLFSVLIFAGLAVAAGLFFVLRDRQGESIVQGIPGDRGQASQSPSSAVQSEPDRRLVGRWLRPDGGYVIEIRKIHADGRMDAAYFNPRPIHVSRAVAMIQGEETKAFIELQDAGYPGSSYTLTYDASNDLLKGIYHQAAIGQDFQIAFVRME